MVAGVVHLRPDVFNDYAVTAVRWLHGRGPPVIDGSGLRPPDSTSATEFDSTAREMRGVAGGIVLAADGGIQAYLLQEKA
jgi:hypothetical protein